MKKNIITVALSLALIAPLAQAQQYGTGDPPWANQPQNAPNAQQEQEAQRSEQEEGKRFDKKKMFKKAGIGCAIGGAFAFLTKNKDKAIQGCALGAVAGGLLSYKEQLDDARAIEQAAKDAGLNAEVKTKEVSDEEGNKGQALDALVISYEPEDMDRVDGKTAETMDKIASLSKKAKNKLTFSFSGKRNCSVPMIELQKRGAFDGHTVMDRCGQGASQIVITPMPEV